MPKFHIPSNPKSRVLEKKNTQSTWDAINKYELMDRIEMQIEK